MSEADDVIAEDAQNLSGLVSMLQQERMLPSPRFRGDLARRLAALPLPWSGRRLWPLVLVLASAGAALLALAALGVLGAGPLAP